MLFPMQNTNATSLRLFDSMTTTSELNTLNSGYLICILLWAISINADLLVQ